MKQKTYTTAVAIIPPESRWEPIQRIRREHDRHVRRWMPHINLLYPFRPSDLLESASNAIHDAVSGIELFDIALSHFRHFRHGRDSYTVWLAPEPGERIVQLQEDLLSAFPDCNDTARHKDGFTPHLSVGQAKGKDSLRSLLQVCEEGWEPLSFPVREIHVIVRGERFPDDVFQVYRTVPLGGHSIPQDRRK